MMRFDQNRIKTASKPHAKSAFLTLKIALVISMTYMALAFFGHWPSHGKPMAIAMASSLSQLQVVVFGTTSFHPIIIQPRGERGDARIRSLAPASWGNFMAKKSGPKQTPKPELLDEPKPAPKPGRPSSYPAEIWDEIIDRHSEGETITSISKTTGMPTVGWVSRKAADDPQFGKRLARAHAMFADAIFDEAKEIADGTGKADQDLPRKPDGSTDLAALKADVHRDRLRIDTRMRIAAKANPVKYSDRLNVNHSGGISLEGVDDAALNTRIERRLHKLGVIELLERWRVGEAKVAEFLALFRVHELPTGPQPIRLLPGETDADVVDL